MLYLIRGLPGAGKSTYARGMIARGEAHAYYEADMFFIRDGEYKFNPKLIRDAHAWCRRKAFDGLAHGKTIIVSNTFTKLWEMEEYMAYARRHGIPFAVIRLNTQYGSIHNVPQEVVEQMRNRFEDYEGEGIID